jgi:hypothetical protein
MQMELDLIQLIKGNTAPKRNTKGTKPMVPDWVLRI